jgi:hypothetical protein
MAVSLTDSLRTRWESYLSTENSGTRDAKIHALTEFVDELVKSPAPTWKGWALDLVARVVDEGADIPIRRPLFEHVLFPALAEALDAQTAGSARWLAGLSQHLYRCPSCVERLGRDRASEWALLRSAVAQDPADIRSRQQLVRLIANHLRYTLHELPAGVLYGIDGATVEQCDELLAELDEFRALIEIEGRTADHAPLVAECDRHFKSYKRYLFERPAHESYKHFLDTKDGDAAGG